MSVTGKNVEIKAKLCDENVDKIQKQLEILSNSSGETLIQKDHFFNVKNGRLKLRIFGDTETAELIQYSRDETNSKMFSNYVKYSAQNYQKLLLEVLEASNGILGTVDKRRQLYLIGQTRIHLDKVEELGHFIEIEVVLKSDQSFDDGLKIINQFCEELQIPENFFIKMAYIDMLKNKLLL